MTILAKLKMVALLGTHLFIKINSSNWLNANPIRLWIRGIGYLLGWQKRMKNNYFGRFLAEMLQLQEIRLLSRPKNKPSIKQLGY
jgi:hypothetical protein